MYDSQRSATMNETLPTITEPCVKNFAYLSFLASLFAPALMSMRAMSAWLCRAAQWRGVLDQLSGDSDFLTAVQMHCENTCSRIILLVDFFPRLNVGLDQLQVAACARADYVCFSLNIVCGSLHSRNITVAQAVEQAPCVSQLCTFTAAASPIVKRSEMRLQECVL